MILNVSPYKSNYYLNNYGKTVRMQSSVSVPNNVEQNVQPLSNIYYLPLNFTGVHNAIIKDIEQTVIYNNHYLPALKKKPKLGLFEFLKELSPTKSISHKEIKEFLFGITKNEDLSKAFIEEINQNPRKASENTAVLLRQLGSADAFKEWYYHESGYQRAYEKYFKKEIFENNKISVEDMIKISPNLMVEALKLKSLRTTGSQDFVIGKIPEELGTVEDFRALTQAVRDSQLVREFVEFRDFMEDLNAFSAKYPEAKKNAVNPARFAKDFLKSKISGYLKATSAQEKIELEKQVPFLRLMKPTKVTVNGKNYTYSPILRPYSTKLLFALDAEGANNRYFVTMEMFNPLEKTCKNVADKENSAMRPDSPYLNAVVDYYLRANGCNNVPEMIFYDYGSNAVIRPFIKGAHLKPAGRTDSLGVIFENTALKKELSPLSKLGVFITDCFFENFMKEEATGKMLIVDNGHAKYSNALRPGVKMIHMGFADLYGRDFVSLDASLERARQHF